MPPKTFVQKTDKHPFLLSVDDVAAQLSTDLERGLTAGQVTERQNEYPRNELRDGGGVAWYTVLGKQISNAMILVLVFAMALSFGVRDFIEAGVLAAVIILNVTIGFFQEFNAEKKMESLRQLSAPSAAVLRDGSVIVVPSGEVVPGDVVILKTGDTVPADLRLFEAMNLNCDEKSLTGESEPVEKTTANDIKIPGTDGKVATSEDEIGIGDRLNMAYSTTTIAKGRGRGIVVFTGMATEVGKIAASTMKKTQKEGRSMNAKKYGTAQLFKGLARRTYDAVGKFLGLTEGTPLQRKLSKLAYLLFGCAILLAIVVFGVNRFNVTNEVAIYAISTGIAIIPESLIAVLTITMVVGMTVMRKANVVIRDLSALEALGGVTNICSDKTGTLTQGAMIVKKAWLWKVGMYTVEGSTDPNDPSQGTVTRGPSPALEETTIEEEKHDYDYERSAAALTFDIPANKVAKDKEKAQARANKEQKAEMIPPLEKFLRSIALCNLATVKPEKDDNSIKWKTTGEPTEIALQIFAHRFEAGKKSLESKGWNQVGEFSFDSSIKRMSVVYDSPEGGNSLIFTKGAVERIVDLCSNIGSDENQEPLNETIKEHVIGQMNALAGQGQRVLAVACRTWDGDFDERMRKHNAEKKSKENDNLLREEVEKDLTLLGLIGIYDPPRIETKPSIRECTTAGIKVHMLTGDHPATATAIAKEIGIIPRNLSVLRSDVAEAIIQKATDFDAMSDEAIDALPSLPLVIARCAPATKTRMIAALRRRKKFTAMTGDGVNDAPSLRHADVGIAMGLAGSDVAKSAAKLVLTDDKFNSIVAAVREGRRLFDNIQKFILHLLSSNVGEVILLIAGLGFQDHSGFSVFPLSPLQILWINMLTSSFPAFGLGREPAARDIMHRKPHDLKAGVFTWHVIADMMVYGVLMGACTLFTFIIIVYGFYEGNLGEDCNRNYSDSCIPVFRARAAVFVELTWIILLCAWEFKNLRRSLLSLNPEHGFWYNIYTSNRFLFLAVVIGAVSVVPAVYIPGLNTSVFKHTGIDKEWGIAIGGLLVFFLGVEGWKAVKRTWRLFAEETEESENKENLRLGLRQGFFTMAKERIGTGSFSLKSISRRGTERSVNAGDRVVASELDNRGRSRVRRDEESEIV